MKREMKRKMSLQLPLSFITCCSMKLSTTAISLTAQLKSFSHQGCFRHANNLHDSKFDQVLDSLCQFLPFTIKALDIQYTEHWLPEGTLIHSEHLA